jgi:hypothetical protein
MSADVVCVWCACGVRVVCVSAACVSLECCSSGRLCVRVHTYPKNVGAKAKVASCPVVGSGCLGTNCWQAEVGQVVGGEGRVVRCWSWWVGLTIGGTRSLLWRADAKVRELGRLAAGVESCLLRQKADLSFGQ